jgi:hypothetical protein
MDKKKFYYVAAVCLLLSFISLFLPVITYVNSAGYKLKYSIIDLVSKTKDFETMVLSRYKGPVVWNIDGKITTVLVYIFVLALLCALVGLVTLRAQYPNTWQFILTIIGLAGVAFPSLVLMICVIGYGKYFTGKISFGPAPIITLISMIACILAVIRRKNKVAEEREKELKSKGLIKKAGDL